MRADIYDLDMDSGEGMVYKVVKIHGGKTLFFKAWIEQYSQIRMEFVPPSRVSSAMKKAYEAAKDVAIAEFRSQTDFE